MLLGLPLISLERIGVPPWLTSGFVWSLGGWGMVWICAALILPAFGVKAGAPLLVILLISSTWNNLRRVRGALSSDNRFLLQSELGGLIGVNVGILAGWLLLFVIFLREFPISALLYKGGLEVLSVAVWYFVEHETAVRTAAVAMVQVGLLLVAIFLFRRLAGTDELTV